MTTATKEHATVVDPQPVIEQLVSQHGQAQRARIAGGVTRVAERWTEGDGDQQAFAALCAEHFVSDPKERRRLLARLERMLEMVRGHLYEIRRNLRRWSDVRGDTFPGVDDLLAQFDPAPDLSEQLYQQTLGFVALLNFDRPSLEEMLANGAEWDTDRWAEVRVGKAFGPRVPAEVNERARRLRHKANRFVDEFHVPVGTMVDANGERWFEPGRKLIAHWLIREQIKAARHGEGGLPLARALAWVMARHVDGTIPQALMAGETDAEWDPEANTLDGEPVTEVVGPERYARWLDQLSVAEDYDRYHPEHPTAIARKFELEREIPEEEVERVLVELLEAPVRAMLAKMVRDQLDRDLEAHDIYLDEFGGEEPIEELNALVRARFKDETALERQLPAVLQELGFSAEDAAFYGRHIRVEIGRGAGHAMRPGLLEYDAWLRTSRLDDQLGWDGFDTAMHELGHNLEQVTSTHRVPRPALRGVPNTACTEAFAFLYQSKARQVIGLENGSGDDDSLDGFDIDAIESMLMACQIAGPGLVELYTWRWLYDHPDPDPATLRDRVVSIADDVWDRFYAEHYGPDPYHLMAAYQHMVAYPLYLPDYALGRIIGHQIRSYVRGRNLAAETIRICSIGDLAPDVWMREAVGTGISPTALVSDSAAALRRMGYGPEA